MVLYVSSFVLFCDCRLYMMSLFASMSMLRLNSGFDSQDKIMPMVKNSSNATLESYAALESPLGTDTLKGVLADAASQWPVPLVVIVVNNLPNRDCHFKHSKGDICCTYAHSNYTDQQGGLHTYRTCNYTAGGDCSAGLAEYMEQYVDRIAGVLHNHSGPVAVVVEPDSLPNLVTNRADARCGNSATASALKVGLSYAVEKIASVGRR